MSEDKQDFKEQKLTRLDLGEAWMFCRDCGAKLYSFDGEQDRSTSCPSVEKCKDSSTYVVWY